MPATVTPIFPPVAMATGVWCFSFLDMLIKPLYSMYSTSDHTAAKPSTSSLLRFVSSAVYTASIFPHVFHAKEGSALAT